MPKLSTSQHRITPPRTESTHVCWAHLSRTHGIGAHDAAVPAVLLHTKHRLDGICKAAQHRLWHMRGQGAEERMYP